MSAEVLRRAAALMRERAEAAYDGGPWEVYELPDAGPNRWTMTGVGVVDDDMGHRADVFLPVYAEHIASWHPAVALAVADWLAAVSKRADDIADTLLGSSDELRHRVIAANVAGYEPALAVARAYLGESA